jgi:DNA-binding NtrC family response regulator
MNILFIEDEKDLLDAGLLQLERKLHTVYPACDIAEARAILLDKSKPIDIVITDHRLPDGQGIQFAIEIQKSYPTTKSGIVSGCLTPDDIKELEAHGLLYFHKPLLYANVVEAIRRHYAMKAQVSETPKETEVPAVAEEPIEEAVEEPVKVPEESPAPKKKFWGLFGGNSKTPKGE